MMYEKTPVEQASFSFLTGQKDHELKETLLSLQKAQSSEEAKIVESFKCLHQLMKKDLAKVHESRELSLETLDTFLS
jgi:hypothetical protein